MQCRSDRSPNDSLSRAETLRGEYKYRLLASPRSVMLTQKWSAEPIRAELYAKLHPELGRSQSEVVKTLRTSQQYVKLSEKPKNTPFPRHAPERWVNMEMKRGSGLYLDCMYLKNVMGPQYCLVVVDWYSKLTALEPLAKLTAATVTSAFQRVLQRWPFDVECCILDKGPEFVNATFEALLRSRGIKPIWAAASFENKSSHAERKIRQVRVAMARLKQGGHGLNSVALLKRVQDLINNTPNSITHLSPNQTTNSMAPLVLQRTLSHRYGVTKGVSLKPSLSTGDVVMLSLRTINRPSFAKSSTPAFFPDLYEIIGTKPTSPQPSYVLRSKKTGNELVGSFPQNRLTKIDEEEMQPLEPSPPPVTHRRPVTRSMTRIGVKFT